MRMTRRQSTFPTLSPEMRLLALCSASRFPAQNQQEACALVAQVENWSRFTALAQKNRVSPMVYKHLHGLTDAKIGPACIRSLHDQYAAARMTAMKLTAELIRLSRAFGEQNIPFLSLKGPAFAFALYGDVSLRMSRDLDLLVKPEDLSRAIQTLLSAGYAVEEQLGAITPRQLAVIVKHYRHFTFIGKEGIIVELHWRLTAGERTSLSDSMWVNPTNLSLFGSSLQVPGPEQNLMYLIVHGSHHGWKRLRWLCDINEIVSAQTLDWPAMIDRAKRLRLSHLLTQTAILLDAVYGTQVPVPLRGNQPRARALAEYSLAFLSSTDEKIEYRGSDFLPAYKRYIRLWNKGFMAKFQAFTARFQPDIAHFQSVRFRGPFFFLYFLIRPCRKVCRFFTRRRPEA